MANKTRITKRSLWFKYYTDESNPLTFLNKTESAIAAKYQAKSRQRYSEIGCQNSSLLKDEILEWFDTVGLTDVVLKTELLQQLKNAKKTDFVKVKGHADLAELHPDAFEVVRTHKMSWSGQGENKEAFDDGDTLIGINVEDRELRRRLLDMAMKHKGLYAPEKRELTGKNGNPMEMKIVTLIPEPLTPDEDPNCDDGNDDGN